MEGTKKLLVIAGGNYIFGAEKITLDVVEGLKGNGYDVTVIISGWGDGRFAAALNALPVKFYKLKLGWYYTSKLLWSLDSLVHYPGAIFRYMSLRKKFRDWPVYIISFRQVILLWPFFKKNIVFHVHDLNSNSKQSRYFLKMIDKKVARYIAVSDFIKNDLVQCGINPQKIEVIHNGITIENAAVEKNHSSEIFTVGIVGQVIERKGHLVMIDALNLLVKRGLKVQLIIAGNGDAKFIAEIKKLIEDHQLADHILWREFKTDLLAIYEGMDIVVAPTITGEPFGLIVIEANMLSLPVIASDTGGFSETVKDGANGFLVAVQSPAQIAEKIEYLYFNHDQVDKMGSNGRENVMQYFDKTIMIKKIDELITNL